MIEYKKKVHKFRVFHGNIIGCLDKIDEIRMEKIRLLQSNNAKITSLIHPLASVSKYSVIQKGTVIMANAVINPFATIGISCIINTNSTIEHDCLIGNGVHISPNVAIAGEVSIGSETWIGIGSSVKQNIKIGINVMVGLGSVVINDIPDNAKAFGVPAKIKL